MWAWVLGRRRRGRVAAGVEEGRWGGDQVDEEGAIGGRPGGDQGGGVEGAARRGDELSDKGRPRRRPSRGSDTWRPGMSHDLVSSALPSFDPTYESRGSKAGVPAFAARYLP